MQIITRIYWVALAISILLALAMTNPSIAVYFRLLQLAGGSYLGHHGLQVIFATAFSFALTNLWWTLLILAPIIVLKNSRPSMGVAISTLVFCFIWFVPQAIINQQSKMLVKNATKPISQSTPIKAPTSIRINSTECDNLCQRILLGDSITTVRTLKPSRDSVPHLMYVRAPYQECLSFDPTFRKDTHCIVARNDDGLDSELIIYKEIEGSRAMKREKIGFSPVLLSRETYTIQDTKKFVFTSATRVFWAEPVGYIPLVANTGFDGNGIHGGGIIPQQRKRHAPEQLDLGQFLVAIDIDVAPRLSEEIFQPHKASLYHSIFNLGGFIPDSDELKNWLTYLSESSTQLTEGEELFLLELFSNLTLKRGSVKRDTLLIALRKIISKRTPEQNRIFAEAYLDNFHIKPDYGLRSVVGKFDFNPIPHLAENVLMSPKSRTISTAFAFEAACGASQRWSDLIAPFVLEHLYALELAVKSPWNKRAIRSAFATLDIHNQEQAWNELRQYIDVKVFEELDIPDFGEADNCI